MTAKRRDLTYPPIIVAAKTGFRLLAQDIRITGAHHVPRTGGVLLAVNHIGYVDFVYGGPTSRPTPRVARCASCPSASCSTTGGPAR